MQRPPSNSTGSPAPSPPRWIFSTSSIANPTAGRRSASPTRWARWRAVSIPPPRSSSTAFARPVAERTPEELAELENKPRRFTKAMLRHGLDYVLNRDDESGPTPAAEPSRRPHLPRRFAQLEHIQPAASAGWNTLVVEQQVGDVRVGLAFPAEGRGLAVARHELDVVAERPQAARGSRTAAARDCRAASRVRPIEPRNSTSPTKAICRRLVHEHHMARRVAGAMHDIEGEVAERHGLAVLQPAVGHERLVGREIVLGARRRAGPRSGTGRPCAGPRSSRRNARPWCRRPRRGRHGRASAAPW